jgi:hypothetical protein
MMVVFEVFLTKGKSLALSPEMLRDTQAQVMTLDEARKVGFQGVPDPPEGREVRLVAIAKRDAGWLQQALEGNPDVENFRVHDVD